MKKMFMVLGVIVVLILSVYFLKRQNVKLTQNKLDKAIENAVSIEEFKTEYKSFFLLIVPEDKEKNSFLINLSSTIRLQGMKINQVIDLGGFYDYTVQDRENIYKTNIIDSNKVSKTLSFECDNYKEASKLYYSDYVELSDEEIKRTIINENLISNNKSIYEFTDFARDATGYEMGRIINLDFLPSFIIDEVEYFTKDFVATYCFVFKP